MIGTFGGALDARKIDASNGRLRADVRGEIESDQGVLVIRRVHVHYLLDGAEHARETVERVHRYTRTSVPFTRHYGLPSKLPQILNLQELPRRKALDDSSAKA